MDAKLVHPVDLVPGNQLGPEQQYVEYDSVILNSHLQQMEYAKMCSEIFCTIAHPF